jgi:hypothetical protein
MTGDIAPQSRVLKIDEPVWRDAAESDSPAKFSNSNEANKIFWTPNSTGINVTDTKSAILLLRI